MCALFYLSSKVHSLWNVERCNRNTAMTKIHAENMQNSTENLTLENSLRLRCHKHSRTHTPISKYFIYNYWILYVCLHSSSSSSSLSSWQRWWNKRRARLYVFTKRKGIKREKWTGIIQFTMQTTIFISWSRHHRAEYERHYYYDGCWHFLSLTIYQSFHMCSLFYVKPSETRSSASSTAAFAHKSNSFNSKLKF